MNSSWEEELDKAFNSLPIKRIEKDAVTESRTYAKTTIIRYTINDSYDTNKKYVILNDKYSYLWSSYTTYLCTLQESNNLQYDGLVGIFESNIFKSFLLI